MPLIMRRLGYDFFPAARCEICEAEFEHASDGYASWPVDVLAEPKEQEAVVLVCSEDCLNRLDEAREDEGEWIAAPFGVYLSNLIVSLGIDVDEVLKTERASIASENTRDQAPD